MNEKSHVGMMNCWICGKGCTILLDRHLRNTLNQNMGSLPTEVCGECKSMAKDNDGIWLISIADSEEPGDNDNISWNPYRTGGLALITKEAMKRILEGNEKLLAMLESGYYFYLNDKIWDHLGLPDRGVKMNNLEKANE